VTNNNKIYSTVHLQRKITQNIPSSKHSQKTFTIAHIKILTHYRSYNYLRRHITMQNKTAYKQNQFNVYDINKSATTAQGEMFMK